MTKDKKFGIAAAIVMGIYVIWSTILLIERFTAARPTMNTNWSLNYAFSEVGLTNLVNASTTILLIVGLLWIVGSAAFMVGSVKRKPFLTVVGWIVSNIVVVNHLIININQTVWSVNNDNIYYKELYLCPEGYMYGIVRFIIYILMIIEPILFLGRRKNRKPISRGITLLLLALPLVIMAAIVIFCSVKRNYILQPEDSLFFAYFFATCSFAYMEAMPEKAVA